MADANIRVDQLRDDLARLAALVYQLADAVDDLNRSDYSDFSPQRIATEARDLAFDLGSENPYG